MGGRTRYLVEGRGNDTAGTRSVKEAAGVKGSKEQENSPSSTTRQLVDSTEAKTEILSSNNKMADASIESIRDNVQDLSSDMPQEWPNDDDDDFVAKKDSKKTVVSTAESKNFDVGQSSNLKEVVVGDETTVAPKEVEHSMQGSIENSHGEKRESFISNQERSIEPAGTSDLSITGGAENDTKMPEQQIATESTPNSSTDETNDTNNFGDAENNDSLHTGDETYTHSEAISLMQQTTDTNPTEDIEPQTLIGPTSSEIVAYHRNESDREDHVLSENNSNVDVPSVQDANNVNAETNSVLNESKDDADNIMLNNKSSNEEQLCRLASNCRECIQRSVEYLKSNNSGPCYWVDQCLSAIEAANMDNPPSGAYKCADNGSSIYTGEQWDVALNAITSTNNHPLEDEKLLSASYYEEDEGDLFENVKFIFNVLLFSAVVATSLLIRKRVNNRFREDPSLEMSDAVKEEVIAFVLSIANYVKRKLNGTVSSTDGSDYRPVTTISRTESFEGQTVPLSTAADEEWGWGDEDTGSNIELSGTSPGDNAEEEEELALAIAMSLSESTNGSTTASVPVKPNRPASVANKLKDKKSPKVGAKTFATIQPAFPTSSPPPLSQGDSIEDLLGQMNHSGGAVITRLGNDTKTAAVKPKPVPTTRDNTDDLFASMGLSNSYPAKSAIGAPASAPLRPSNALAADMDDDADWGDDGDLDDLLDD